MYKCMYVTCSFFEVCVHLHECIIIIMCMYYIMHTVIIIMLMVYICAGGTTGAICPGPQLLRGPQAVSFKFIYSCKNNLVINFGNFYRLKYLPRAWLNDDMGLGPAYRGRPLWKFGPGLCWQP